jgi:hypothetical protein
MTADNIILNQVIVHKVGNPTRGEQLQLSANALTLNDTIVQQMLTKYFVSPFNENEQYHFTHITDVSLNEVYHYISNIFDSPAAFTEQSAHIAQFLYNKSTHVRVKEGEMYLASFSNVPFDGDFTDAIGIFKSESKETFLKVFPHGQSWEVIAEDGVNINKLDKGCLVFRKNKEEGYTVCIVDNTNKQQDAQYWVKDFLQVNPISNDYRQTDDYLGMCKLFIDKEYADNFEVNKTDRIDMMNRSMDYFKTKDHFNLEEFAHEVMHHPEVTDSFISFKKQYEVSKELQMEDEFDIHLAAVKKQSKQFKSILKLDKNFHVYIHGRRDLIERGYDEMKQKHFYTIYFDEES